MHQLLAQATSLPICKLFGWCLSLLLSAGNLIVTADEYLDKHSAALNSWRPGTKSACSFTHVLLYSSVIVLQIVLNKLLIRVPVECFN